MTTQLQAITKHNEQVEPEFRLLTTGMVVADHTILYCTRQGERVIGETYASWIVLAETTEREYHKWVTWRVVATERGFFAESGHYFTADDWENAYGNYEKRGGR